MPKEKELYVEITAEAYDRLDDCESQFKDMLWELAKDIAHKRKSFKQEDCISIEQQDINDAFALCTIPQPVKLPG